MVRISLEINNTEHTRNAAQHTYKSKIILNKHNHLTYHPQTHPSNTRTQYLVVWQAAYIGQRGAHAPDPRVLQQRHARVVVHPLSLGALGQWLHR